MTVFKTSCIYVGNTRLKMLISVPESMIERQREAFPGGPVVQWLRTACQCEGHGFDLYSGKIPRASGQLSPCAATM